jgi:succinate dehydrogenase cytochrome b556 subunit/succinate dehydrogenase hydrophobic membrane anchor protein
MASHPRPTSPFMLGQAYRLQLTSFTSFLHRVTGVFLALGIAALVYWLIAAATSAEAFDQAQEIAASIIGRTALLLWTGAFFYHLLNGLRHLAWDAGWGFSLDRADLQRRADADRLGVRLLGAGESVMASPHRNLRSDLGRVRGLGSAKEGVQHWWMQRVTAIALIPLSLWFVACIVFLLDVDRATAVDWLGSPVTLGLMSLFLIALVYHAVLGLQVVVEDYIHSHAAKITLLLLIQFAGIALAAAGIIAMLMITIYG